MYTSFGPGAAGVDLPFPEAAALAGDVGFDAIQVDLGYLEANGPDAYREVLSEHGLRNGSAGLPVDLTGDRETYESDVADLPDAAERLAAVGCDRCSTYVLSFSDERPFEENFEFHRERLEEPARILEEHGVRLGLEFLGPETLREGHEYEFVHDAEGMLDLCAAVDADNLGLLLDCWHWYTSGGDAATLEALDADDVVDVHVNDAPAGVPREEQVDDVRRLPGETGVIDVETFLRELDRTGYDGPVMAEPFSDDLPELDPEDAARRTLDSIETVFERAGL